MFSYPEDMTYTTMAAGTKIDPFWYGMKFAPAPRYVNMAPQTEGATLVMQYVEGYVYRTYGMYRANDSLIPALYNKACELDGIDARDEDYPTLSAMMTACFENGYVKNGELPCKIGYIRPVKDDLKYFLRQYGQLILETRITDTTYNQSAYNIDGPGKDLGFENYSKGFIMYGYDANDIYVQNTRGVFAGSLGFHKISWGVAIQLIRRGACWLLENPG